MAGSALGSEIECPARGHVERLAGPRDRRSKAIRATAAGKKLYKSAADTVREAEDSSLRDLTEEERSRLRGLLRKIAFTPAGQVHGRDR